MVKPIKLEKLIVLIYRLKKLNKLKASDELPQDDLRQLSFDIENALSEFHRVLGSS